MKEHVYTPGARKLKGIFFHLVPVYKGQAYQIGQEVIFGLFLVFAENIARS